MADFRRVNFIPLTADLLRLDTLKGMYVDITFAISATRTFTISDPWEANLPGIAHQLYGDINYWWILGLYNGILDPITDVIPGRVIKVPNKEDIIAYLKRKEDQQLIQQRIVTL